MHEVLDVCAATRAESEYIKGRLHFYFASCHSYHDSAYLKNVARICDDVYQTCSSARSTTYPNWRGVALPFVFYKPTINSLNTPMSELGPRIKGKRKGKRKAKAKAKVTLGPLGKLSAELLSLVLSFLPIKKRARLLLVNSAFYAAIIPILYSHLSIFHQIFDPPMQGRAAAYGAYVEVLDLYDHHEDECHCSRQAQTLARRGICPYLECALPRLRALRLHLDLTGREIHDPHHEPGTTCQATMGIRPDMLILRDVPLFLAEEDDILGPEIMLAQEVIDSAQHLVCVLTSQFTPGHWEGEDTTGHIMRLVGKCTTDLTFVFWTRGSQELFIVHSRGIDATGFWLSNLVVDITDPNLEDCNVTFVNAGSAWFQFAEFLDDRQPDEEDYDVHPEALPSVESQHRRVERWFRSQVEERCLERGFDDEAIWCRQDSIRFITVDEYLAEPAVLDVFDLAELVAWKKDNAWPYWDWDVIWRMEERAEWLRDRIIEEEASTE
ncbi:uncharacterized protein LOC62_05G007297 [Vanrija pseudolonga]|uniref:F-box domain-containing protein n=1 Tax=Vanrija pseudolonga TaxID=143232 RepID=A0AAF1BP12_9TREE|nr:hypothetical protein LOC62_05G007297 [Vanrija pseudolonga]